MIWLNFVVVFAFSAVDHWFEPGREIRNDMVELRGGVCLQCCRSLVRARSNQTKDYTIGFCCFSTNQLIFPKFISLLFRNKTISLNGLSLLITYEGRGLGLGCFTPLSTILQLYRGSQF